MISWIALIIATLVLIITIYHAGKSKGYFTGYHDAMTEVCKKELDHIKDILQRHRSSGVEE